MKKIILTIALVAAAAISANAQLRVEAGFSAGNYVYDDVTTNPRMAPQVRAFYEICHFGENAGLEVGAAITGHKAHQKDFKSTTSTTNLDIPAHLFYNLNFGGVVITPMIGLYGSYAVSGKFKGPDLKVDMYKEADFDAGIKRFDLGMDDELLITIRDHFTVGLGGQIGFLNISDVKGVKTRSNAMYVTVGWKF